LALDVRPRCSDDGRPDPRAPHPLDRRGHARALAAGGPDAVRVDRLAQTLHVTRGGFYWHFEDRAALLDAILDAWERRSTDEVLERVERESGSGASTTAGSSTCAR
jgi:AcrR family transcriptional regulator